MTCILCDKPLKTLRKITWKKEVCGNEKCKYYNVGNPPPLLVFVQLTPYRERVYIYQDGRMSNCRAL